MQRRKVFGVGFHKTGTTSLAAALKRLGYRVTGPNGIDDDLIAERAWPLAQELVGRYDAFQDNPWPILFRELDAAYPESRFILTIRDTDAWVASTVRHFGRSTTPMRAWIYGVGYPEGNEATYRTRYEQHNRDVIAHFAERPQDLLVLRVTEGEGWEALCPFLGADVPEAPFPRENTASYRRPWRKAWRRTRAAMRRMWPGGQRP